MDLWANIDKQKEELSSKHPRIKSFKVLAEFAECSLKANSSR